jgi:hypothetical protein
MKQQWGWGWGGCKRYLEKANNNGKQLTTSKVEHQSVMARQQGPSTNKAKQQGKAARRDGKLTRCKQQGTMWEQQGVTTRATK